MCDGFGDVEAFQGGGCSGDIRVHDSDGDLVAMLFLYQRCLSSHIFSSSTRSPGGMR